jgi:alpha-tubulin suppressor-like RCC1 family protein
MVTITWLAAARRRVPVLGAVMSVLLATGLAGPAGAAAAPAAKKTALLAWGQNAFGQLGNGKTTDSDLPVTVKLPSGVRAAQVRGGSNFAVALTVGDGVFAWGNNRSGQLGLGRIKNGVGHITSSHVPVSVHLPRQVENHIAQVRAGSQFALALTSTGEVYAWGAGDSGDLGDGQASDAFSPVHVAMPGGVKIAGISTGCLHSLAVTPKGEVLAWGNNKYGQLGDDSTEESDVPVRVDLPRNFKAVAVAAGCYHSLALGADGEIFAWGNNQDGQLGDGQPNLVNVLPVEIFLNSPAIGKVVQIYGGCEHTLAMTTKGVVLAWGHADDGELGDGSFAIAKLPVGVHLPAGDLATIIGSGPASSSAFAITTQH